VQDGATVPPLDMSALAAAAYMASDAKFYLEVSLELGLGKSRLVVAPQKVRLRSSDTMDRFMDLPPDHVKFEVLVQVRAVAHPRVPDPTCEWCARGPDNLVVPPPFTIPLPLFHTPSPPTWPPSSHPNPSTTLHSTLHFTPIPPQHPNPSIPSVCQRSNPW
jgi:hypothetical protein